MITSPASGVITFAGWNTGSSLSSFRTTRHPHHHLLLPHLPSPHPSSRKEKSLPPVDANTASARAIRSILSVPATCVASTAGQTAGALQPATRIHQIAVYKLLAPHTPLARRRHHCHRPLPSVQIYPGMPLLDPYLSHPPPLPQCLPRPHLHPITQL